MESLNGSSAPQSVAIGDAVLYYANPLNRKDPALGWICRRPGINTVSVLVFSPESGFIEKPSVRHIDDPGLAESASWRQWGAWEYHPMTATLKKVESLMPQIVALLSRNSSKKSA
jgi:hypothetical protein